MAVAVGCYAADAGRGAHLCFDLRPGSYDTTALIAVLEESKRFYEGEHGIVVWEWLST